MKVLPTLAALVPSPKFGGSLTPNTREAYEALVWEDERPRPSWDDLVAKWPEVEAALADQAAADAFDMELVVERLAAAAIAGKALKLPKEQRAAINARRARRGEPAV